MSNLEDKKTRAMIEAATSPLSLVPFITGGTAGIAMYALSWTPPVAMAVAGGAIAWGVASALARAFSSDSIKQKVEQDILAEAARLKKEEIDKLLIHLTEDEESLLNEILGLQKLIKTLSANGRDLLDVSDNIKKLLEHSYMSLFKIPMLDEIQRTVGSSKAAIRVIHDQRESIRKEVKANIEYVAQLMAEFHTLGNNGYEGQSEVRKQLTLRLEAAKEFNGQMSALNLGGVSAELIAKYSKVV